jgi:hypothetical protein
MSLIFLPPNERLHLRHKSPKTLYNIVIELPNGVSRTVKVKATSREKAEKRALKFHPSAVVKRGSL